MDVKEQIGNLRTQARDARKAISREITINGRPCTVTATPRMWAFLGTNIKIESQPLDGRICTVDFTHNKGREVAQGLQSFSNQVLSAFPSKIAAYTKQMPIDAMGSHATGICTFLCDVENFVRQNDLTENEITDLRQKLRSLCSTPIIQHSNGDFSINGCDRDSHCRAITLQAESLEILLDAKACGQVGLERNVPPPVKVLGRGYFNTVKLAHTQKGKKGPIVLKPCDQARTEKDLRKAVVQTFAMLGPTSGSYRRNQATSRVQDMLCEIGKVRVEVPRVIATVSAAEIGGTSCIAMEMLEGEPIGPAPSDEKRKRFDNNFMCRETWMQVQDVLTGQIDRHGNNVMLTKDGPVAIDHDLSFPTNPPRSFAYSVPDRIVAIFQGLDPANSSQMISIERAVDDRSRRNYCMPPVIDRGMYDVIIAIDLGKLETMYQECGLTRHEIGAAMARAQGLKAAAQWLMVQGRVIEPNRWAESQRVWTLCNGQNFYAARHYYGK
ncbi:MAG: hypothetical protein LBK24_01355 [Puniceicoccales bacterium]|jgi:hypothetical protein|nr:hypothetical protein [Puniceicoccales bacterium]